METRWITLVRMVERDIEIFAVAKACKKEILIIECYHYARYPRPNGFYIRATARAQLSEHLAPLYR
jgi:hypothetical protein